MHVNTDDLVDIAEGTRPDSSAPHLARCEACRARLDELRTMMSAARDVDIPEPSPLFWDHLSQRVREAVAAERVDARQKPSRSFVGGMFGARAFQASVIAGLLLAVALHMRAPAPPPIVVVGEAGPVEILRDFAADEDSSLTLVASLTRDLDLDDAREAGLAPHGSAEHAVMRMNDRELRELGRLLKEELARPGA